MTDFNNEESQLLDDDVVPQEYPPEEPYGVNERLTPSEEQIDEPLAERVKREEPDTLAADGGRVGQLVASGSDEYGVDAEAMEIADELAPPAELDQLDVDDPTAGRDATQDKEEVVPAEEAAMHLTDPPPMGDGDGYLEDEAV